MIRFDENGRRDKRTRWSVDHAPLRIAFGRELAGAKSCDWVLPRGWVDSPASGNSSERRLFTRLLTWEEMAFLGCHLDQMDLPAQACDEDGKWWVSGYRLYAAGLIDDASTLLVELSAEQSKKMFGTPTPSAFDFMVHGLRCYADQLWTLIMVADVWAHHYFALGDPAGRASQLRWRAARWRREVIDWLAEHGIEDPPPRVGIVPRSQHNRLPKMSRQAAKLSVWLVG